MGNIPWSYDQFQRYSVLKACLDIFFPGKPPCILDVGGAAPDRNGKNFWLPVKEITYGEYYVVDPVFCDRPKFIQASGLQLPFKDDFFDIVTSLDVLEHIPGPDRKEFLSELCRVSRDIVLLSCPFQDEKIKKAEENLFNFIKNLHDQPHQQLEEHISCGLPDKKEVTELLSCFIPLGVNFSFGSLDIWLFIQSFKSLFLQKHNVTQIQEVIDRFVLTRFGPLEFKAPFYRHFWLHSAAGKKDKLELGVQVIKRKLAQDIPAAFPMEKLFGLNEELIRAFNMKSVSAVVVPSRERKNLDICLDHLLTQEVEFNLEVTVWNLFDDEDLTDLLKAFFPAVKDLSTGKNITMSSALMKLVSKLKGDYILLISENILLPSNSVKKFYEKAGNLDKFSYLIPLIWDREGVNQVRFWDKKPAKKIGRKIKRLDVDSDVEIPSKWTWSECRFYSRAGLLDKEDKRPFLRENIFLSGGDGAEQDLIYFNEFAVSRRGHAE